MISSSLINNENKTNNTLITKKIKSSPNNYSDSLDDSDEFINSSDMSGTENEKI